MDSGGSSIAGDNDRAKGYETKLLGIRPKLRRNNVLKDVAFY